MKKALSLILAIVMVALMAFSVSAATVKVSNTGTLTGHTYTVYQIFSGDVKTETDGDTTTTIFSNVEWGKDVTGDTFLAALKNDSTFGAGDANAFAACQDAADVAEVLGAWESNSDEALAFAKFVYDNKTGTGTPITESGTTLDYGYYLVVDTTTFADGTTDTVYNSAILKVVSDDTIEIGVKTDKPTVEKKVFEEDYSNNDTSSVFGYQYDTGYNDVADYDMGDTVKFRLYSKVPDMTHYETYKMIFHDTMSKGLTYTENTISVKVGVKTLTLGADYTFDKTTNDAGETIITVTISNLKAIEGVAANQAIIVYYEAVLNQEAVIGLDGNPNEVYLEYSNKPDESAEGDTDNLGQTPVDEVIVFTYQLDVTKVDGNNTSTTLPNAEFELSKVVGTDTYYAVVNNGKITSWSKNEADASPLTTDSNGKISVAGIDDGTYYLTETEAPSGYNLLDAPVEIILTAATDNGQNWTSGDASKALTGLTAKVNGEDVKNTDDTVIDFTKDVAATSDSIVSISVANNKGAGLPETGGIGTHIFYIVGGLLMLGAVVFLVARKRTSAED